MTPWAGEMLGLAAGLLAGGVLGAVMHAWQLKRKSAAKLYLPAKWPLASRALVNATEEEVWTWLREVFPDHQVMVKIPVLRFTTLFDQDKSHASPKAKAQYERWMERLSGVYTTFVICTVEGKVLGCVDVPGKTPLSKTSRELKETLLSDCGIAYTVVAPASLPAGSVMRAAFLGEVPTEQAPVEETLSTQGADTCFRAELKSFSIQEAKKPKDIPLKKINKGF